jgi:hypothetical protein
VLDSTRATDWTGAGVTGGIPTNRTQCGSTIAAGASTATINNAINACGNGTFVKLGVGTFGGLTGINLKSGVTLRGSGADQTFLVFTNSVSCQGQWSPICAPANDLSYYAPGPPSNIVNWTSGFSQGTTTITLSSVPSLSIGMYIMVDGLDGGINANDIVNCSVINTCTTEAGGGASANQRTNRAQREMFKVTNIVGNTVTLNHGLRFPNWATVGTPQAWWGDTNGMTTGVGLEDLSIDGTNAGASAANITFMFAAESWIKGVRSLFAPAPRANILLYENSHVEIRNSYLYGSTDESSGPTHYGIEFFPCYDCKIENNIIQRRTSPVVLDGSVGSVIAYNYAVYDTYLVSPTFLQGSWYSHEGGNGYNLWEGNIGPQMKADIVHGTSNMNTSFRGYYPGWEPGKSSETGALKLYALQRFYNIIGNVLGRASFFSGYLANTSNCGSSSASVIMAGCGGPVNDAYTANSVMLWGNYDTFNGASRFVSGEVPSGLAKYANAVPGNTTLPASFAYSSKPSWFGSAPWPPIGPDVTGQTVNGTNGTATWAAQSVGGHVAQIPALSCYKDVMGGPADGNGNVLTFNAASCYP